jgi:hypothetical protein
MVYRSSLVNDGSSKEPELLVYLNLGTIVDLREDSVLPQLEGMPLYERLLADGFQGVQLTDARSMTGAPLPHCGLGRIDTAQEADGVAARHADQGDQCITVHLGWGLENDREVFALVEAVLEASSRYRLPIFIETHRATITQDIWRTVQIARMFPEVRFNGDFSHYYCGQELVYGDWNAKLEFMKPIFERIGFLHGRIASPGCMQMPIDASLMARPIQAHGHINYLVHFRELWILGMLGFLGLAGPGDALIFAPELLSSEHYYARMFPFGDKLIEECDRYAQALLYKELAQQCFAEALRIHATRKELNTQTGE